MTSVNLLDEAIELIKSTLTNEEKLGRIVSKESAGRWAVYDGPLVKMLWIENEAGLPVSVPLNQELDSCCQDLSLQSQGVFDESLLK